MANIAADFDVASMLMMMMEGSRLAREDVISLIKGGSGLTLSFLAEHYPPLMDMAMEPEGQDIALAAAANDAALPILRKLAGKACLDEYVLCRAARTGCAANLRFLLGVPAVRKAMDYTPIQVVSRSPTTGVMTSWVLRESGGALWCALEHGHMECAYVLLGTGADPLGIVEGGRTILDNIQRTHGANPAYHEIRMHMEVRWGISL